MVPAVSSTQVVLSSSLDPLDGPARLHCAESNHGLIGIDGDLDSEAAPDLGSRNAQLVLGDIQNPRQEETVNVRVLARQTEGQRLRP